MGARATQPGRPGAKGPYLPNSLLVAHGPLIVFLESSPADSKQDDDGDTFTPFTYFPYRGSSGE